MTPLMPTIIFLAFVAFVVLVDRMVPVDRPRAKRPPAYIFRDQARHDPEVIRNWYGWLDGMRDLQRALAAGPRLPRGPFMARKEPTNG